MPLSTRPRRAVVYTVAAVSLIVAILALWRTIGTETTATDLGEQVNNACALDRADATRKGLNCAQAESVAGSPVTLTQPPATSVVVVPGPATVLTETQQVPLPLPTISVVQLPGATDTIVTVTPGPTVTETETVTPPPETVTETQTVTQTETQTVTETVTPEPTSSTGMPIP